MRCRSAHETVPSADQKFGGCLPTEFQSAGRRDKYLAPGLPWTGANAMRNPGLPPFNASFGYIHQLNITFVVN